MKNNSARTLVFLSVMAASAAVNAEMTFGPLMVDDASVLPKHGFELRGIYSRASVTYEPGPMAGEVVPLNPSTGKPPDPLEIDATISALNYGLDFGVTSVLKSASPPAASPRRRKAAPRTTSTGCGEFPTPAALRIRP